MAKIILINNWGQIRKIGGKTILYVSLIIIFGSCLSQSVSEMKQDRREYLIPTYNTNDTAISRLYDVYLDSCRQSFQCTDLRLVRLSFSPKSEIWIHNSQKLLTDKPERVALFKFPGGSFIVDRQDLRVKRLMKNAVQSGDTTLVVPFCTAVNKCLFDEASGSEILAHISFTASSLEGGVEVSSWYTLPK